MLTRLIFPLAVLLVVGGCAEQNPLPINEEKFVEVLTDVHIAEGAMMHLQALKKDTLAPIYYGQVMEIHQIDRATFDTCMAILQRDPALMEEIYKKVMRRLDSLQAGTQ